MAERGEAMEQRGVRDAAAGYQGVPADANQDDIPPGYKRTEVGVIPEDWEVKHFSELGVPYAGLTYNPSNVRSFGTLVLRSSNIKEGKLVFNSDDVFVDAEIPQRVIVREGDILICVRNGSARLIGKCARIPKSASGHAFGAFMTVFRANDDGLTFYMFQSDIVQRQIQERMGATINQITGKDLSEFLVPVPTAAGEQSAIATALSDADALIESLDRLLAKKRAIKQAAMQQLLTGQTRLPGFTGEWETKRVGNAASFHKGSGLSKADLLVDGDSPCIHYGELFTQYGERITSVNSRTDSKAACFKSIENDVLMPTSDVTPNGLATASCIAESNVNLGGDILIIRPNGAEIDGTFLAYKIRMDHRQIMQLVSGTTVFHIYGRDMAEFTCKAPTTEEQQAIVSVLSDMETEIEALDRRRDKARQIKEGMMQQLLTGRVRLVAPQTTEPAA